jgi:hypothetical protein
MLRVSKLIFSFIIVFAAHSVFSQTINKPINGQSFRGEITINAAPEKVWQVLTNGDQLIELMDYTYISGAKTFAKIGDAAQVKVWDDACGFMVVRSAQNKELRFNLDPENGTYICNCRWTLSKSGNGTKLLYVERYTESDSQTAEAIASQVKDANARLKKLKALAEK